ncbi:hypothetical protein ACFLRC_05200 [Candidatus Altiarchaeota archaeon]
MQRRIYSRNSPTDYQSLFYNVLYYTQLLGLALGLSPREVALEMNRVRVQPMLAKAEVTT